MGNESHNFLMDNWNTFPHQSLLTLYISQWETNLALKNTEQLMFSRLQQPRSSHLQDKREINLISGITNLQNDSHYNA